MKGNDKLDGACRVWEGRLPVGPLPGSRFALYFYCNELDRENVFLVFKGKLFEGNGLRVLRGGWGVDSGSLAGF